MDLKKIIFFIAILTTLLLPVHAQDYSNDTVQITTTETDTGESEASSFHHEKINSISVDTSLGAAEQDASSSDADVVETKNGAVVISATSTTAVAIDAIPKKKKNIVITTQPLPPIAEAPAPCLISDTTGCPNDPCLAADSVLCQPEPPVESEDDSSSQQGGVAPLFSFNPLWVVGPVTPSNPSAGTLVTAPIPIELTETGPNPRIIGQADGRVRETVFTPVETPVSSSSITGLISGANLPWLGLLVLLVFGIFAWRGRKQ